MKRTKLKAVVAGRKAALLGAAVVVPGLSLLTAAPASAAPGAQPGTLTISPATGPLGTVPTWSTSSACPPTANGSAKLLEVNSDRATFTAWSANIDGASTPLSNEKVIAGTSVRGFEAIAGYRAGQTSELVLQCYTGPSGTGTAVRYLQAFITFNTGNTTYTVSAHSGPGVAPTSTDSPASTSTAAAGTPSGAAATGGGPAPGSDAPMAVGGIALLLVGGGLVLSRWRTAAGSLARRRRATGKPES